MYSFDIVTYALSMSIQKPMRSVSRFHSSMYLKTDSRQRSLNSATPNRSMSALVASPSSCSISSSTGRPWQSQPALRTTRCPRIVL